MKNKQIINLIKRKAEEVEIKDFHAEILARVNTDRIEVTPIIKRKKTLFRPLVYASLSMVMTVFAVVLMISLLTPSFDIKAYEEPIALSALSSVMLFTEEQSIEKPELNGTLLSMISTELGVEEGIDELSQYFGFAEMLLKASEKLEIKPVTPPTHDYRFGLSFRVEDLLGETYEFVIYYQHKIRRNGDFEIEGTIFENDQEYPFIASGSSLDAEALKMRVNHPNGQSIEIESSKGESGHHFEIRHERAEEVLNMLGFTIKKDIASNVEFILSTGIAKGRYQFEVNPGNQRGMKVSYQMQTNGEDTGEIDIDVDEEKGSYRIVVRPSNGMPFDMDDIDRGPKGPPANPGGGRP